MLTAAMSVRALQYDYNTLPPTHASHSQPIALTRMCLHGGEGNASLIPARRSVYTQELHAILLLPRFDARSHAFLRKRYRVRRRPVRHCAVEDQMWFQCTWGGLVRRGEERNHREIAHASPRSCPKTELKTLHGVMVIVGTDATSV